MKWIYNKKFGPTGPGDTFYACRAANRTIGEMNIDRTKEYVKLGQALIVVRKPKWWDKGVENIISKNRNKSVIERIFYLEFVGEVPALVSDHLLQFMGRAVSSADHCNQLRPVRTYKLRKLPYSSSLAKALSYSCPGAITGGRYRLRDKLK